MIQSSANLQDSSSDSLTFSVCRNGNREMLTYPQLFESAHRIWQRGDFSTARAIFGELSSVKDLGPRAHIFLAHCYVMQEDYGTCSAILHRALPKDVYGDAAGRLHDAFVLWKVGLFVDVKDSLKSLALEHAELPTFSLLLADLFHSTGSENLSSKFLRRAIRNDVPGGAVAQAARTTLKSISSN